ncbi:MAG: hypothetical protein P9M00_10105 [Candidatus Tritonobacter lacicola]|nr:hypothetical protein [Candidatus Tritonobacter lacicola]
MKRRLVFITIFLVSLVLASVSASGAEKSDEKAALEKAKEEKMQEVKDSRHRSFFQALYHLDEYKPTWKYLEWGVEERIRFDAYNNLKDVEYDRDDRESQFRFRTRVWTRFKPLVDYEPLKKTEIYMRWVNEYRAFTNRKRSRASKYTGSESVIMDQLYLKLEEPWKVPMYLRVGRMDMAKNILGDGFFFYDFTPGESSRTKFFDGFDVGFWWPRKDKKADHFTMLQVLGAYNTDDWYAVINEDNDDQRLLRRYDRERWLMFWLTHESKYTLRQKMELFYMPYTIKSNRHDEWGNDLHKDLPADMRAPDFKYTPDMKMHVFGGRLSGKVFPDFFDERLSYLLQAGWQMGSYGDDSLQAYCASTKAKYKVPLPKKLAPLKPYVSAGYEVFSGDKEDTDRREGWVWPPTWQSPRPPYGHVVRDALRGYEGDYPYSNMQAIPVELGWSPFCDKVTFKHYWAPIWALERRHAADPDEFGNTRFKGNALFNVVKWDITKWLSTKVQFEYFKPGNFYYHDDDTPDPSWFARYELNIKF